MNHKCDFGNVDEIKEHFLKKTSFLKECLELRNLDNDSCKGLLPAENAMVELSITFQAIKEELRKGEEALNEMQCLLKKIDCVQSKLDDIQDNFPAVLNYNDLKMKASNDVIELKTASDGDQKKSSKIPPKVPHVTESEFETVPKYMKSYYNKVNNINNFVDVFNKAVAAKYQLLCTPRSQLKPAAYKVCQMMKAQESEQTKGIFFCTCDDLKQYSNVIMDNRSRSFLTILRHCSRIKEIRGPGPIIRYAVKS